MALPSRRLLAGPCLVAAAVLGTASLTGCGGGDDGVDPAKRATLVEALGFLTAAGLSEAEVECVADRVIEEVGEGAIDEVAATAARVEAGELGLADLPGEQGEALTASVTACAGST